MKDILLAIIRHHIKHCSLNELENLPAMMDKTRKVMTRTFHSVGQGALYSEKFKNFTMIYDCGSSSKKSRIEDELKSFKVKNNVINSVFISHFHNDHINGLKFLIDNFTIKYLFLPLLTEFEKILWVLENAIHETMDDFIEGIILDPEENIKGSSTPRIIRISPNNGNENEVSFDENQDLPPNIKEINSGTKLLINSNNWMFVPFHFRNNKRTECFITKLKKEYTDIDTKKAIEFVKDKKKFNKIKKSYKNFEKEIDGSLNSTSLVLYSGPSINQKSLKFISYVSFRNLFLGCFTGNAGCIYFGDYEANGESEWYDFNSYFYQYWDNLGSVQIPHHGSVKNYRKEINEKKPVISILSYGKNNPYGHPSESVIKDILQNNGYPMLVTEEEDTRVKQKFFQI